MLDNIGQCRERRGYGIKLGPKIRTIVATLPFLLSAFQAAGDEVGREVTAAPLEQTDSSKSRSKRLRDSILDAARMAEKKHDNVSALNYYRTLYERDPKNIDVVIGMSRSLRRLGRSTQAEALVERSLKTTVHNRDLLAEMGKVSLSLGKAMPAIDSLSRAESLGAKAWDIYTALAVSYDRAGMFEQAEIRYRKALQLSPDNAVVLNNYALSRAQAGNLDQAIEHLRRASALPESTPRMRQNLALFYAIKGDLKAAEDLVRWDLPPEAADANMAYYRQLRAQVEADGGSTNLAGITPKLETAPATVPSGKVAKINASPGRAEAKAGSATAAKVKPSKVARIDSITVAPVEPLPEPDDVMAENKPAADNVSSGDGVSAQDKQAAPVQNARLAPSDANDVAPANTAQGAPADLKPVMKPDDRELELAAKPIDDGQSKKQNSLRLGTAKVEKTARLDNASASYRLQLGAFRDAGRAEALIAKLEKSQESALGQLRLAVENTVVAGKGDFFRVVSDEFDDKELGRLSCDALKKNGFACLLSRRR